jgi:septum formation protein
MAVLYLASQSPRRRQLLEQIGVSYETVVVDVDERWDGVEEPTAHVQRLALEKARCARQSGDGAAPVLAADTGVVLDGRLLGKALDREDAMNMLQSLSGRSHDVYTAVALVYDGEQISLNHSRVCFKPLSLPEREVYCDSGEPYGKAGGYAIQGLGAAFISRLEGSYSGVMGLPLYETAALLAAAGILPPAA